MRFKPVNASTPKLIAAWVAGIVVTFTTGVLFTLLGDVIGVPSYLKREFYDEDGGSNATTYGFATLVIAVMIGTRAGMWIARGTPRLSPKDNIAFLAWLCGAAIVAVTGAVVFLALHRFHGTFFATIAYVVLDIGGVVGAWLIVKPWRDRKLKEIKLATER